MTNTLKVSLAAILGAAIQGSVWGVAQEQEKLPNQLPTFPNSIDQLQEMAGPAAQEAVAAKFLVRPGHNAALIRLGDLLPDDHPSQLNPVQLGLLKLVVRDALRSLNDNWGRAGVKGISKGVMITHSMRMGGHFEAGEKLILKYVTLEREDRLRGRRQTFDIDGDGHLSPMSFDKKTKVLGIKERSWVVDIRKSTWQSREALNVAREELAFWLQ